MLPVTFGVRVRSTSFGAGPGAPLPAALSWRVSVIVGRTGTSGGGAAAGSAVGSGLGPAGLLPFLSWCA